SRWGPPPGIARGRSFHLGVVVTVEYERYIQSAAWRRKREAYWRSGLPKNCYVCDAERRPGMHLHHRTYKNLGSERLMDLVPLCPGCHDLVHRIHREPKFRRKGLWYATKE